jgi:hypothetical protein
VATLARMPQRPQRPAGLVGRVFPARLAIQYGLISRDQLRGSAWRRLFHGIYSDATLADTHRPRCAAALRWLLPDSTVVAGRSAAALYRAGVGEAAEPVEVIVAPPHRVGAMRGLRIHHGPVDANDLPPFDRRGDVGGAARLRRGPVRTAGLAALRSRAVHRGRAGGVAPGETATGAALAGRAARAPGAVPDLPVGFLAEIKRAARSRRAA